MIFGRGGMRWEWPLPRSELLVTEKNDDDVLKNGRRI